MKLRSKYSSLCDHDTSMSQTISVTDRRTDDLQRQYRALRSVASRGKHDSPVQT